LGAAHPSAPFCLGAPALVPAPSHLQLPSAPDTTCRCCLETGKEKALLCKPHLVPAPQGEGLCVAATRSQHPTAPATADEFEVVEPFLSAQHFPNKFRCENQM